MKKTIVRLVLVFVLSFGLAANVKGETYVDACDYVAEDAFVGFRPFDLGKQDTDVD